MHYSEVKSYYDFILPLVLESGKTLSETKEIKREQKNGTDWDLISDYDKKIEDILIAQIRKKFPTHSIIAEEESSAKDKVSDLTNEPTWFIDPIDGTENFIKKLRVTCISVAMTINKDLVFGIAYNPFMDELFTAIKGQGAYLNGEQIRVSGEKDLKQSFFDYEISMGRVNSKLYDLYMYRLKHLMPKVLTIRAYGSAILGLCYVACGRFDAYQCDGLYPWDAAAGTLIVREAGGYVRNSSGKEFDLMEPNFIATSTKQLSDQYMEIERIADAERERAVQNGNEFVP
ncbi:uncharacterized protein LOC132701612 [Cylas formicarius]|uniref:uncharacterized protein LOC132701612 n=1 Tax=Cylas formicarius TaxID=197179 RepID=UPI0029583466|nr:uncharacterized protein LOC132701612 [Cylas formicarius]